MQLSPTKCITYQDCPQRFHYKYDLKLFSLPSDALDIGKLYHDCLERYHTGTPMEQIKNSITGDKKELICGMLDKYLLNPVLGNMISAEEDIELDILDIKFIGIVDRLDEDKIVEYKTTSKDYKNEDAKTLQSDAYVYYYWKTTGKILPIIYSINNKKKYTNKKYIPQIIVIEKTEDDLKMFEDKIVEIANKIRQQDFSPTPSNKCYWCDYGRKGGVDCCKECL